MPEATASSRSLSDGELIRRYLSGESEAFATLVRRYRGPLFSFLVRFTGDRSLADDVFQEAFLVVHNKAATIDPDQSFRAWLYTVAANKARDAMRKKFRHREAPLDANVTSESETTYADLLPSDIPNPHEITSNQETRQAVQRMVSELPQHLREVLALGYFDELPYKQIAEVLSVPVGTVKSRMHAATRAFAEKYKAWSAEQRRKPDTRHG